MPISSLCYIIIIVLYSENIIKCTQDIKCVSYTYYIFLVQLLVDSSTEWVATVYLDIHYPPVNGIQQVHGRCQITAGYHYAPESGRHEYNRATLTQCQLSYPRHQKRPEHLCYVCPFYLHKPPHPVKGLE